jgi:putative SOS response-associated peptidase YedK
MDVEMRGRMYALELLTTQLISEYLRTVPDAPAQTKWAKGHLHEAAETLAVETESLDDEARLRVGNARAEGVAILPAFRDAFKSRRCLIPAFGFCEWQKTDATKQPYAIVPEGDPLFAFAGLWENWRDRSAGEGAEWIRTCAIVTGEPNELVAPIHDRMPVILDRSDWAKWLGEYPAKDALLALLKPFPAERMRVYSVSAKVNSVKNDEPSLIEAAQSAD